MIRNYLTIAWRNLMKSKAFSFINVLGLSVGMAACFLITAYVIHELSYDNFFTYKERIYRVQQKRYDKGVFSTEWAAGCSAVGQALKENFPEVEHYVRMRQAGGTWRYNDIIFKEPNSYFASEDFFKVFDGIHLVEGQPDTVLSRPFTAVLSQSTARKYFKGEDPVGKTMKVNDDRDVEITGVFQDVPENCHMHPDILLSFETVVKLAGEQVKTAWQWDGFYNYILLKPGASAKDLESKIPAFVQKTVGEDLKKYDAGQEFYLMPVTDIHLDSHFIGEFEPNGNRLSVYFLTIIAVFIIIIAWINYVNLSTARSMERAREVGLRKAMGSLRAQLIRQFLFESTLLNLIAVVLAVILVIVARPWFSAFSGHTLDFSMLSQGYFWAAFAGVFLAGILLSGLYPAFVLSNYKPVVVLKGKFGTSTKGLSLRKSLVVFQFLATIVLITCTFTVYRQITYMRNQAVGAAINQTLVLRTPGLDSVRFLHFKYFKDELLKLSGIDGVAASTEVPGQSPGWNAGGIRLITQTEHDSKQYRVLGVDYDFIDLYHLQMVAGRKFSEAYPHDQASIILNEAAVDYLGFPKAQDVLDKELFFWGDTFKIVGVVKNYHQQSPKADFEPLLFRCIPDAGGYCSIRINTADIHSLIDKIEKEWDTSFPTDPFDYFFLDDHYNNQYKADMQFGKVVGLFSSLAVIIACLGLFGLSSLSAIQRTKEIGVRKALGASVSGIVMLMGRGFMILIGVAIVLSIPLAWWTMHYWLGNFASRIALSWWIFALPSLAVVAIAMGTIAFRTLQAAHTNPATSLRYE